MLLAPNSLDQRVASLSDPVDATYRTEIHTALRTLRDASNVPGTILVISRLLERPGGLLSSIAARVGVSLGRSNLQGQIDALCRVLPDQIAEELHWVRRRSNEARHGEERLKLSPSDAETAINYALRLLEWFYGESDIPCMPHRSIYGDSVELVTLSERYRALQQASDEQLRLQAAGVERLRQDRTRADASEQKSHVSGLQALPLVLPALHGTFVDREAQLHLIEQCVLTGEQPLVLVIGPGGYGKTELVTKFLKHSLSRLRVNGGEIDGIVYLRCVRGDVHLDRIFAEVGRIFDREAAFVAMYRTQASLLNRIESLLSEVARLGIVWLVFDNLEDLLSDNDRFVDVELGQLFHSLLTNEHTIRVVATSRATPVLAPYARCARVELAEGLPDGEAIKCLRADGAGVGLASAPDDLLARFNARVHGIPKAIESLVGYLAERYPAVTLRDLLERRDLFDAFDEHDVQRGLKRLVREQFEDQAPDAQLLLCALSVFTRPVPLEAVRYLLPALEWTSILARLVRNRLIKSDNEALDLHPLVRAYAYSRVPDNLDKTVQTGNAFDKAALHERAAAFYKDIRQPAEEWISIDQVAPQLDEFHHRVYAQQFGHAAQIVDSIGSYLPRWGASQLLLELRLQLSGKLPDLEAEWENELSLARCLDTLGRLDDSTDRLRRLLAMTDDVPSTLRRRVCSQLAHHAAIRGAVDECLDYATDELAIARRAASAIGEDAALNNLARVEAEQGRFRDAMQTKRLGAILAAPDAADFAFYATLAYYVGDLAEMADCIHEALRLARKFRDPFTEGYALSVAGEMAADMGAMDVAVGATEEARSIGSRLGFARAIQTRTLNLGRLHHFLGNRDEAVKCFRLASGMPRLESSNWLDLVLALGDLLLGERKTARARCRELTRQREMRRHNGDFLPDLCYETSFAYVILEESERSLRWFDRACARDISPGTALGGLRWLSALAGEGCDPTTLSIMRPRFEASANTVDRGAVNWQDVLTVRLDD